MSMRSQQLKKSVASYIHTHNAWVADDNRPNPDEAYWDAVDTLINTFDHGGIPQDCRDLATAVDGLALEFDKFDQRQEINNAMPGESFWTAREILEKLFNKLNQPAEQKRPRETVAQLAKDGVHYEQIARMWGLVDDYGRGKAWLIEKELATPGSVIGKDYVHPDDAGEVADAEEVESVKSGKLGKKLRNSSDENKRCHETPRQLWEQGVGVPQATRMLVEVPEAEVKAMWDAWDIEREQAKLKTAAKQATAELAAAGTGK